MINQSVLGDQGPEGAISFFLSPSLRQRPENNSAVAVKVDSHQHIRNSIRERWKWQKKRNVKHEKYSIRNEEFIRCTKSSLKRINEFDERSVGRIQIESQIGKNKGNERAFGISMSV